MPQLAIYPRDKPDRQFTIWPSSGALPVGFIQENGEYCFELTGLANPASAELYIDHIPIEALRSPRPGAARWRWSPGFHAGRVEVTIEIYKGARFETILVTDPDIEKVTREDFDGMVKEILEDTLALFALSGFRTGVARGVGSELPPLARLEFLRSRIKDLEQIVTEIQSRPLKILGARYEQVSYRMAKRVRGIDLKRSFTAPPGRLPVSSPLSSKMKGYFPTRLFSSTKISTFDLPEHRIIKACLKGWQEWLKCVGELLERSKSDDEQTNVNRAVWARNCGQLASRIGRLLEFPLFEQVSTASNRIAVTAAFRRIPAYRRFFNLYRDLQLGIARIQGDFLQMPLARTFELYELWAFLRLLRAAIQKFKIKDIDPSSLFDITEAHKGLVVIRSMVLVPLRQNLALGFKREFKEFWLEESLCGSFSRRMIPDVSVSSRTDKNCQQVLILDAKYRVTNQLSDAIASLHMYRDAILQSDESGMFKNAVVGAYILTPHVSESRVAWKEQSMPGRLFHPEYRSTFKFGAVTLRPGMSLDDVDKVLSLIMKMLALQIKAWLAT